MVTHSGERSGPRTFLIIWLGQFISLIGSGLTSFALGVYIYDRTGAATQLALSLAAASVPNLVLLPFAGALIDRWDRRQVLILSDTGAALVTLTFWVLLVLVHHQGTFSGMERCSSLDIGEKSL